MNNEDKMDALTQAVLEELANEFMVEQRLPGDVTRSELEKRTGMAFKTVNKKMQEKIDAGEYIMLEVHDSNTGRNVMVYRKVERTE